MGHYKYNGAVEGNLARTADDVRYSRFSYSGDGYVSARRAYGHDQFKVVRGNREMAQEPQARGSWAGRPFNCLSKTETVAAFALYALVTFGVILGF